MSFNDNFIFFSLVICVFLFLKYNKVNYRIIMFIESELFIFNIVVKGIAYLLYKNFGFSERIYYLVLYVITIVLFVLALRIEEIKNYINELFVKSRTKIAVFLILSVSLNIGYWSKEKSTVILNFFLAIVIQWMYFNYLYDKYTLIITNKKLNDLSKSNDKIIINKFDNNVEKFIKLKEKEIKKHNIRCNIKYNLPENIQLIEKDLFVILGNLISNAIEASRNCYDKENLFVNLNIFYDRNIVAINCENFYDFELNRNESNFTTNKLDKSMHGKGLNIVKKYVNKNHGNIQIDTENNLFSVNIIIKLESYIE